MAIEFNAKNFESEVLNSDRVVMVDFWAPWCPPCRALGPIIEELAADLDGQVKVGKLNIDDYSDIAARYNVSSIPSVLIFNQGSVTDTITGLRDKAYYLESVTSIGATS